MIDVASGTAFPMAAIAVWVAAGLASVRWRATWHPATLRRHAESAIASLGLLTLGLLLVAQPGTSGGVEVAAGVITVVGHALFFGWVCSEGGFTIIRAPFAVALRHPIRWETGMQSAMNIKMAAAIAVIDCIAFGGIVAIWPTQ